METIQKLPVETVFAAANRVLSKYSKYWRERQSARLRQFSEEISLIYKPNGTVIDLGGGDGIRAAICTELGMQAYNVDIYPLISGSSDYLPSRFRDEWQAAAEVAKAIGVHFEHADCFSWRTNLTSIDVVMSFDTIEHLHHSPRALFEHLVARMTPGGYFLIGAPNAANILKRLRVLHGYNVFSRMEDWYCYPHFAGHVREPIVADFIFLARDLGLSATIFGANWMGLQRFGQAKILVKLADKALRPFPTLCSNIYSLAQKSC